MAIFRKRWTPEEAEEWTREDTIAVIISPIVYILLMVGTALSLMLVRVGYVMLGAGIVLLVVLVRVIHPKLSAISRGYEQLQKYYLERLERTIKWEE